MTVSTPRQPRRYYRVLSECEYRRYPSIGDSLSMIRSGLPDDKCCRSSLEMCLHPRPAASMLRLVSADSTAKKQSKSLDARVLN